MKKYLLALLILPLVVRAMEKANQEEQVRELESRIAQLEQQLRANPCNCDCTQSREYWRGYF